MLRNKVFLETEEYDIYMFPIPETVLKGKKFLCTVFPRKSVKQWALSWMEKLHPCFDGRFINDIRFYKENGKIMALVTVAEKMQIAPHLVKKHTAVYVHRPYKRRVFAAKSPARKLLVVPAFAFTIGLAVLSGFAGHGDSVETSSAAAAGAVAKESVFAAENIASGVETVIISDEFEEPSASETTSDAVLIAGAASCADIQDAPPKVMGMTALGEPAQIPETPVIVETPAKLEKVEPILASVEQQDFAKADETSEETTEEPEFIELTEPQEPSVPKLSEPPFLDDFLSLIFEAGGSLSSFLWQTFPTASATLTLEGCFPEDVYNSVEKICGESETSGSQFAETAVFPLLSFSSISYKDNIPSFSLTIDYSSFDLAPAESKSQQGKTSVPAAFRQLIVETGGNVTSESIKPPFISGSVPVRLLSALSGKVAEHFAKSPACGISQVAFDVSSVSPLTKPDVASIFIHAEFDNEKPVFFPLENIASIYPESKLAQIPLENDEVPLPVQEQPASLAFVQIHDAVKIGSVCMEDGTYISFYRRRDGKIIKGDPYEKQKEP